MEHNHNHNHSGHHHHLPESFGGRLLVSMAINLVIPVAQIIGGLAAGSVALISDAVHNLSDFSALVIAFAAHKAGKREASPRHTFGFKRLEILAAVVNSALLGGAAVFIAGKAVDRLIHPVAMIPDIIMGLAFLGIVGNGISAWLLSMDSESNLNARGAFLHMLGDMLTSVAVFIGALVMRFVDLPWIDPVLSFLIVAYIFVNAVMLLKEAVHVLMNGTPTGLDLQAVRQEVESITGVSGIHYLHAWTVGDASVALTCHVVVPNQNVSDTESLYRLIASKLLHRFGIDHPVLQFETVCCGEGELLCKMGCNSGGDGA